MAKVKSVCIYCGSRSGAHPGYADLAKATGEAIASAGLTLVYGGGQVGLMGICARSATAMGGRVVGIIPEHLDKVEIAQTGLTELHIVSDMHSRKRMMFDRSDAFIVLPGGMGTLDEFIEVLTWSQLDLHDKPIFLLNHDGYWEPLLALLNHVVDQGFANPKNLGLFKTVRSLDDIFHELGRMAGSEHAARADLF
ncbi:cytokinin riboside 5'-monophosphate phosphoribohydrolase [Iodidimonas muriae]|uniref:Cytokinin riboside 5'-monophosphate phosphoribohydrolase n=1 Tax=Iodidimonas muriae TaxID=261467 RepID=A0ABQ2L6N8_9PROT|nr:TIGR00730 family Rossman fold protein [Iodidimonas muriae]GGO05188.1 cytokinin riboside 5'-monophosphate phosphoribohydrolase [Iodidimonas muriae]